MKKIFTIVLLGAFSMVNAQAFSGKGDAKLNIGLTAQNGGSGIQASTDFGLGENFSIGILGSYYLAEVILKMYLLNIVLMQKQDSMPI